MPNQRPAARAVACSLAQAVVAGGLGSGLQAFEEAGLVPDDAGGDPVGKLLGADQIARA